MLNRTAADLKSKYLVAYQDDKLLIFNFTEDLYLICYKKSRKPAVQIEKIELKSTNFEDRSTSSYTLERGLSEEENSSEEEDSMEWAPYYPPQEKFKHLICITVPELKKETVIFFYQLNNQLGNAFKVISIDGANLVFHIESTSVEEKPIPMRVPKFNSIREMEQGIPQLYCGMTCEGALARFTIRELLSQKKTL